MADRRGFLATLGLGAAGALSPEPPAPPRRIHLLTCFVAGFRHHAGTRLEVERTLAPGLRLRVVPEPDNRRDANALAVTTERGEKLGYVPRIDNEIAARLARQAVLLEAEVVAFDPKAPSWDRLEIAVFQTG